MGETAEMLTVDVVWADRHAQVQERCVQLSQGATLRDAVKACGLALEDFHDCGVWGRRLEAEHPIANGDRVELYQPLKVDPKVARRERFAQQGARSAGLFKARRAHSKAGY